MVSPLLAAGFRPYGSSDFDLWSVFSRIPDRRSKYGRRYPLPSLLIIALAAMLCGRKNQASIARWARYLEPCTLALLGIKCRRAPCPATWCTFFQSLNADDLETCLGHWVRRRHRSGLGHIAIDGKYLRGSRRDGRLTQLLTAFSDSLQGVIAATPVPPGTTEIRVIEELFKKFPLPGSLRNTCLTILRRLGLRPVEGLEHFARNPDRALAFLLPQGAC